MTLQLVQQRVVWHAYRIGERLGVLGLVGLALTIAAILAALVWLTPLRAQLADLQREAKTPVAKIAPSQTPEQALQAYLKSLPPLSTRAAATQAVIHVADEQGLVLNEVAYKTDARPNEPLAHYHMQFGLYANYADIQSFLSELLNSLNYVSIETLSMSRETAEDDLIEARIDLALHFHQREESADGH